ncbi:MAG: thioredoxin family protein [Candidatus Binataceae bacterium]
MRTKRKIEIFSAGCVACDETVATVRRIACSSCEIEVLDMHDPAVATKAKTYGVRTVPAVAVDGRLAACCAGTGPDEASLRAAGVGVPAP